MAGIEGTTRVVKLLKDLADLQADISKTDAILSVDIDNLRGRKNAVAVHMRRRDFLTFKKQCGLDTEVLRHSVAGMQEQVVLFNQVRVFSLLDKEEYQVDVNIVLKEAEAICG